MKNMTIENIAAACGGEIVSPFSYPQDEIKGAVLDSRLVEEGYLFFATKGEKVDGHDYVKTAFEKGALCAVCERVPEGVNGPVIVVKDSFVALKQVAAYYRSNLNIKVVGITGSVGKTSTKECIASVLSHKFDVLKTEGNFNNEVGLPLTVLKIRDNHEIAVLEMGISDFGEMSRLAEIARPDVCVITNIGQCHLEKLIDRDGVLKAKTEMFNFMKPGGNVVLFGDDDKLSTISYVNGVKPIFYGLGENNDITAADIVNKGLLGSDFTIKDTALSFKATMPLPGKHMIYNALAATAVGRIFKMEDGDIAAGIASVKAVGGRSNIIDANGITIIDDCYNANPVSVKAAIDLLCEAITPKVAVLGDMFELGENEAALHREVGVYAAERNIDTIILVGELSKNTYEGAMSKVSDPAKTTVVHMKDIDELCDRAPGLIRKDDAVLIKASHGMNFTSVVGELVSDRYKDAFKPRAEKLFDDEEKEEAESKPILPKNEGDKTIMDVKPDADKEEQKKAWKQVLYIAIAVAAVALIIAGVCFGIHRKKYNEATRGIVLIENTGALYSDGKIKDKEIAASYSETDFFDETIPLMTDGKYIYRADRIADGEYNLTVSKVNGKSDTASFQGVSYAKTLGGGRLLYISDDILYVYNAKENSTSHIATSICDCSVSDKKDGILMAGLDGKLSYYDLNDNVTYDIDDNVEYVWVSSDDKKTIIYEKSTGELLMSKLNAETVLLTDNYTEIYTAHDDKDGNGVYFLSDGVLSYMSVKYRNLKQVAEGVTQIYKTDDESSAFLFAKADDAEGVYHLAYRDDCVDLGEIDNGLLHHPDYALYTDNKNSFVYILDRYEEGGTGSLICVDVKSVFKSTVSNVAQDVISVEYIDDKDIWVCKDSGSCDLYDNGNLIARNVVPGSLKQTAYKDAFVFAYQVSDDNGYYRLSVYNGKELKEVGTAVIPDYYPMSEKLIYYLGLGDEKRDVMKYNGSRSVVVSKRIDWFKYIQY